MGDQEDSTRYGYLASVLRDRIRAGTYRVGEELPPIGTLAQQFDVSHMTVKQSLRLLSDEGVVMTRRGARARVIGVPTDAPAPIPAQLQDLQARVERLEKRVFNDDREIY